MNYGKDVNISILKCTEETAHYTAHYIEAFHCGNRNLDSLIRDDSVFGNTVAYLFIDKDNDRLVAYCSLSCSGIMTVADDAEPDIVDPRTIIPSIEIKFFAVDCEYRSLKMEETSKRYDTLSASIFQYCIYIAYKISTENIGAKALLLYSVPEAQNFYKRGGFQMFTEEMSRDNARFVKGCIPMYRNL